MRINYIHFFRDFNNRKFVYREAAEAHEAAGTAGARKERDVLRGQVEKQGPPTLRELGAFLTNKRTIAALDDQTFVVNPDEPESYEKAPERFKRIFALYRRSDGLGKLFIEEAIDRLFWGGQGLSSDQKGNVFYGDHPQYSFNAIGRPNLPALSKSDRAKLQTYLDELPNITQ